MPRRDAIHYLVKQALVKDGWQVTDDPYVISYGERFNELPLNLIVVDRKTVEVQ